MEIKIEYFDEGTSQRRKITVDGKETQIPKRLKRWLLRNWLDELLLAD